MQYKELINVADKDTITDKVSKSYIKYDESIYRVAGGVACNAIRSAEKEYDERHRVKD